MYIYSTLFKNSCPIQVMYMAASMMINLGSQPSILNIKSMVEYVKRNIVVVYVYLSEWDSDNRVFSRPAAWRQLDKQTSQA